MKDQIRLTDELFVLLQNNLSKLFEGYGATWVEFEYSQGARKQSSRLLIRNPLLMRGGFDVLVDEKKLCLAIDGHPMPDAPWPLEFAESSISWIVDAIAKAVEFCVEEFYNPTKDYSDSQDGVRLNAHLASLVKVYTILLDINGGALDKWFGSDAQQQRSAIAEMLPWRAEKFWEFESWEIPNHLDPEMRTHWNQLYERFIAAGFQEGYEVSVWDIGSRLGSATADEVFSQMKKKGIVP